MCYTADEIAADYGFLVHTKPAVYHGVRTTSSTYSAPVSGTIKDQSGNTSTISATVDTITTTTSSVPYDVDYILKAVSLINRYFANRLKLGSIKRFGEKWFWFPFRHQRNDLGFFVS